MTVHHHGLPLDDPTRNGVYLVRPARLDELDAGARGLGMYVCRVNFLGCRDKADLLARLAGALRCPGDFGGNWDALADVLRDLSWLPASGRVLLCEHADELRDADRDDYDTLLDLCREAAGFWSAQGNAFRVFLGVADSPRAEAFRQRQR